MQRFGHSSYLNARYYDPRLGMFIQPDWFEVTKAGVGTNRYGSMQQAALARGYDLSDLCARLFSTNDFTAFDLIIGMDDENITNIEHQRPAGDKTPVHLFTDYVKHCGASYIPDPYYIDDFETALTLIEQASRERLNQLQ